MTEVLTGVQRDEGGGFFGIHTGDNKPRAQHESSVRKEADLISVRRVLSLMRISRQKAEK